nr:MAG TPA: hypothetical protein [Caudoviricetes sp.]
MDGVCRPIWVADSVSRTRLPCGKTSRQTRAHIRA